jgi:hypothetical protein
MFDSRSEADSNKRNTCDFACYGPEGTDKRQEQMGCEGTSPGWKHRHVSGKVHLLHEQGYVIRCVGNVTEEKSPMSVYFPTAHDCQKYVESRMWKLPNDGVTVESEGFWRWYITLGITTGVLGLCPSSGILKNATFRKLDPGYLASRPN